MAKTQETLQDLLRKKKVNNAQLAKAAGIARQTTYNLVEGNTDSMSDTLADIATALKVPAQRVFLAFRKTRESAAAIESRLRLHRSR